MKRDNSSALTALNTSIPLKNRSSGTEELDRALSTMLKYVMKYSEENLDQNIF